MEGEHSQQKEDAMIGMDFNFICFLILLVISVVVSAILHYGIKLYIVPGICSFISKVIIGWIGAWLGSPVFGHWWEGVNYQDIYIIPAILGSLSLLILAVDLMKTAGEVCGKHCASSESPEDAQLADEDTEPIQS